MISTTGTLSTSSATGETLTGLNTVGIFNATNTSSGALSFTNTSTTLTVTGISDSGGAVAVTNTGSINATGTISAGAGQNLSLTATGALSESGSGLAAASGAGIISLSAGSTGIGTSVTPFNVSGNNLDATTSGNGNEFLSAAGSVTIDSTGLNAGTGTVTLDGGTFTLGGSNRINDSTSLSVNGATFAIGASSETVATVSLTSGSITGTTGVLTSTNTIQTQNGTVSADLGGTNGLTQTTAGTTTLSAANEYTGTTTINGGTLLVDGSITGAVMVAAAGTLGGSGSVGSVTNQGTVSPGDSPGILTINGNYVQTGSLTEEIQGTTPGTGFDQLVISGTISLGGALNPSLLAGFLPSLGGSFQVVTNNGSNSISGTFAGLTQGAQFNVGPRFFTISYVGGAAAKTW